MYMYTHSSETGGHMRRQEVHGVPSAPYHLPPVAPKECVRHTVWSQVMDALWYEVVDLLQPLVLAARDRALKGGFCKRHSMDCITHSADWVTHLHNMLRVA